MTMRRNDPDEAGTRPCWPSNYGNFDKTAKSVADGKAPMQPTWSFAKHMQAAKTSFDTHALA